jgi:hypothetical protein
LVDKRNGEGAIDENSEYGDDECNDPSFFRGKRSYVLLNGAEDFQLSRTKVFFGRLGRFWSVFHSGQGVLLKRRGGGRFETCGFGMRITDHLEWFFLVLISHFKDSQEKKKSFENKNNER